MSKLYIFAKISARARKFLRAILDPKLGNFFEILKLIEEFLQKDNTNFWNLWKIDSERIQISIF